MNNSKKLVQYLRTHPSMLSAVTLEVPQLIPKAVYEELKPLLPECMWQWKSYAGSHCFQLNEHPYAPIIELLTRHRIPCSIAPVFNFKP